MRALALAPVLALALVGCGVPRLATDDWEPIDNISPGQVGYWTRAADHYRARAREAAENAKQERIRTAQARLYWVFGMALLAALGCAALAVFLPGVRKWAVYGAIAAVAVAALAWFLAWLVPYLIWVGLALAVLGAGAAVVYWKRDNKALSQVVQVVEEKVKPKLWDYRDDFREYIDTDVDRWIDARRKQLGLVED